MDYFCQNCLASITLDESLRDLSPQQLHLLLSRTSTPAPRVSLLPEKFIPQDRLERHNHALLLGQTECQPRNRPLETGASRLCESPSFVFVSDTEDNNGHVDPVDQDNAAVAEASGTREPDGVEQLPDFSKIKSLNEVFRILLTNQDVGHPMCKECAALLTDNYKQKFDYRQHEKEMYASFLKKLKDRADSLGVLETELETKLCDAENELQALQAVKDKKLAELQGLEESHADLTRRITLLDARLKDLNETQLSDLFRTKNMFNASLQQEQARLDQANTLYKKNLNQLDRLRSLNVYTKLFEILFDSGDGFGRINGCRLGHRVPWPELNVSLGHVARLLAFLAKRLDLLTHPYEIVPMGLKSYILKQGSKKCAVDNNGPLEPPVAPENELRTSGTRHGTVIPLYSSNEFTLGKLFNFNSIDVSMLALLDILRIFERYLVACDDGLAFPYVISTAKGTVGGRSARISSNGPWTEACRYLLIDINWILSYVSAQPVLET